MTKQSIKCFICKRKPNPDCSWRQGRCPHQPSLFESIKGDNYKARFYNLLNWFKGKK